MIRKKLTTIILCSVMAISLLAGCSGTDDKEKTSTVAISTNENSQTPNSEGKVTFPYTGEQVVFKGFAADLGLKDVDTLVTSEYKKQMGNMRVEWEFAPWADYDQKSKLYFNSGDMPDVIWARDAVNTANTYSNSGIFLDWNKYKDIMPNLSELVGKMPWLNYGVTQSGERLPLYQVYPTDWSMEGWTYNKTLLEKHGLQVPQTQEEFVAAMRKIKAAEPKVIPYLCPNDMDWAIQGLLQMYGLNANTAVEVSYNSESSKWEFSALQADGAYKKAIEFMSLLWKEKLMNLEINTMSPEQVAEKFYKGEWLFSYNWHANGMTDFEVANPGKKLPFDFMPMATPTLNGKAYQKVTLLRDGVPYWGIFASAKTAKPELLAAYMDKTYSAELNTLNNWGVEGKTFKVEADGKKSFLPDIKTPSNPNGTKNFADEGIAQIMDLRFFGIRDFQSDIIRSYNPKALEADQFLREQYKSGRVLPVWAYPAPQLSKEEMDLVSSILNSVKTYVTENTLKFVMGNTSMDQWNKYIEDAKKMGNIDAVLNLYNSKPQYKLGERSF